MILAAHSVRAHFVKWALSKAPKWREIKKREQIINVLKSDVKIP